jgi:ATP-dependent Lon protease
VLFIPCLFIPCLIPCLLIPCQVLFIATANSLEPLPPALLDRMEVVPMAGYTLDEKVHIARQHVLPRQLSANGLPPHGLTLPDTTLSELAEGWTREAGLRNLEREIACLCRSAAVRLARLPPAEREGAPPTTITPSMLPELLGPRRYERQAGERLRRPGVALGLAWTAMGGELLVIETSMMEGSGELILVSPASP